MRLYCGWIPSSAVARRAPKGNSLVCSIQVTEEPAVRGVQL